MRKISSSFLAAVLVVCLSTTVIATPAFAMQREGPGGGDPIVRLVKQILKKLGIMPTEQPAVPHP